VLQNTGAKWRNDRRNVSQQTAAFPACLATLPLYPTTSVVSRLKLQFEKWSSDNTYNDWFFAVEEGQNNHNNPNILNN